MRGLHSLPWVLSVSVDLALEVEEIASLGTGRPMRFKLTSD